ncbi:MULTISPECIES: hypothetical protein [unclassified Mycobacterium]|uniref:hypothetical protein n=1 Tax=unclassified Mycobacterium TaxID=2642494 RepID=UPI0029C98F8C|nr:MULTISPECIES: hypothetical protein [unclassified Mycobacterium]
MEGIGDTAGEVNTGSGTGTLSVFTYPAYCGFAQINGAIVAPEHRGLITWAEERDRPGHVVGYANPLTPPGVYPFLHYFQSPDGPAVMRAGFDHPIEHRGGPKHVAPILYDGEVMTAQVT